MFWAPTKQYYVQNFFMKLCTAHNVLQRDLPQIFFRHSKLAWKKINLKILGLMCYQQKWPRLLIFFPLFHLVNKKLNSGSELEILNLLVVINELQSYWHSYLNPVLRPSWIVLKFVLQQTSVWHWIYSSEILFGIFRA